MISRSDGRFIWVHCSTSSARRVRVRATSSRISRIRALGACSAICWHSAARTRHVSAVSIAGPKGPPLAFISKQNPAETGEEPAGFRCAWHAMGAKLAHKPGDAPKRSKKSVRKKRYSRLKISLFKLLRFCVYATSASSLLSAQGLSDN